MNAVEQKQKVYDALNFNRYITRKSYKKTENY